VYDKAKVVVFFNIFSNGITAYMSEEKLQVQAMEKQIISALLPSDK
jgi:hypothetical protein